MGRKRNNNNNPNKNRNNGECGKSKNNNTTSKSAMGSKRNQRNDFNDSNPNVDNDASWYAANDVLLNNAANLSFPYATGSTYDLRYSETSTENVGFKSLPGVMALRLMPTVGSNIGGSVTPVNMAANNIYSFVRHMNSGASNYDAPDLMIYLLAMDSCYSYYSFLTRVYGVMRNYSSRNYYKPQVLVQAMGIDYDDVEQHLSDLRYYINLYASKLETLRIPTTMSYLTRHMWIYSGLYRDFDNEKAQIYMYVPDGFYQYNESIHDTKNLGQLTYKPFLYGNPKKYADLVRFGNELLEVNRNSEDHNIMSGDIAKAFGTNLFSVPSIGDDYSVEPVYSREVMMQIHNATVFEGNLSNNGVKQDPATGVLSNPITIGAVGISTVGNAMDTLLDMDTDDPKAADIMVATRLVARAKPTSDDANTYSLLTSGSEVVAGVTMYNYEGNISDAVARPLLQYQVFSKNGFDPAMASVVHNICDITKFDWAPILWIGCLEGDSEGTSITKLYPVCDCNNTTVLRVSELEKMNEVALLSMFGVK